MDEAEAVILYRGKEISLGLLGGSRDEVQTMEMGLAAAFDSSF